MSKLSEILTKILKVDPNLRDPTSIENIRTACTALHQNQVVAFPTETVYGLGASCQSSEGVKRIYQAKNRPADNPLIIHVSSQNQLESTLLKDECEPKIPKVYHKLVSHFWPGPLTILLPLPKNNRISKLCTLNQTTFGVRVPSHPVARALIEESGLPLAAPSANASTRPSCTCAAHVLEDLSGRIPFIIDAGSCDVGVESTVVDGLVSPPQILRPGGVSIEDIKRVGGKEWESVVVAKPSAAENESVKTPGMKYTHYSPRAKAVLFLPGSSHRLAEYVENNTPAGSCICVLGSRELSVAALESLDRKVFNLPLGIKGKDIAHNLFAQFREADHLGADLILVEGVEPVNEGLAIMNRLHKAVREVVSD